MSGSEKSLVRFDMSEFMEKHSGLEADRFASGIWSAMKRAAS